jgi:hypothetical protein
MLTGIIEKTIVDNLPLLKANIEASNAMLARFIEVGYIKMWDGQYDLSLDFYDEEEED